MQVQNLITDWGFDERVTLREFWGENTPGPGPVGKYLKQAMNKLEYSDTVHNVFIEKSWSTDSYRVKSQDLSQEKYLV